jgi:hypothetical protein
MKEVCDQVTYLDFGGMKSKKSGVGFGEGATMQNLRQKVAGPAG